MSASRTWLNVPRAEKSQSFSGAVAIAKALSPVLDRVKSGSGIPVLRLHSSLRSPLRSHRPGILREELLIYCHCEEIFPDKAIFKPVKEIATSQKHAPRNDASLFVFIRPYSLNSCNSCNSCFSFSAHQSGHPRDGHRCHPLRPTHRGGPVLSTCHVRGQKSCLRCGWWKDDGR